MRTPFPNPGIENIFQAYPDALRKPLLELRDLIFATAHALPQVGTLQETLKWGQPSYVTAQTRSGSTIRLDRFGKSGHEVALFFHCQTTLVDTMRSLFAHSLTFSKNRAIVLNASTPLPKEDLAYCITMALTYHLRTRHREPAISAPDEC